MTRRYFISILFICMLAVTSPAGADEISINSGDTINTVLTSQMGKRVSITMKSGQVLSGTVSAVTDKVTHISELTGKEFYDAVVATDHIESVTIRVK